MNLKEAIIDLNVSIPDKIIKKFKEYIDYKATGKMNVADGLNTDIRNVFGHHLNQSSITDKVLFNVVKNLIWNYYFNYKAKFPQLSVGTLAQVDILKYAPGGKYEIHTDHGTTTNRTLSVIINLNDEYEGGDLVFYHPNSKDESKRVKAKTGKIIFFPSNFLYPHCVEPVKKGTRYSIVSWLI